MAHAGCIGKLFSDVGLLSMLVDSDMYVSAMARLMLEGKQVSRGNRGMKLVLEALYWLYYEAFWAWLQQLDQTDLHACHRDSCVHHMDRFYSAILAVFLYKKRKFMI